MSRSIVRRPATALRRLLPLAAVLATVACAGLAVESSFASEKARVIPPPAVDEAAGTATSETVVLAGGCFWGVQGVFQHLTGVTRAVSGYAGGEKRTAEYERVSGGSTGHAESVEVTFDPRQVSYGALLQVFFSVVHDPTQLNRQGPDTGPQYRSAIFPASEEQARVAKAYIDQLNAAHAFEAPLVTTIESGRTFFPAEGYHQDYLTLNPNQPYIVYNDLPKIENLKQMYPALYRADPVLVAASATN
jgi:peptide-methionine (S)-S-oxide reductase